MSQEAKLGAMDADMARIDARIREATDPRARVHYSRVKSALTEIRGALHLWTRDGGRWVLDLEV